ncbi:MAG TPA: sulfatase-like hydrolase/transferase, partial [Prolixibacteraceae bacterium]|nr:sulfatase-like hydrolase/transferase [Prolixibacteraceae bacterium]
MKSMVNKFLTTSIIAVGAIGSSQAIPAPKNGKPNLLLIMTDQQRFDALGIAGNKVVKTPNLDRLARQGVW